MEDTILATQRLMCLHDKDILAFLSDEDVEHDARRSLGMITVEMDVNMNSNGWLRE